MPGKNGIEVFKVLSEEHSLRSVEVVMMCTHNQKKEIDAACLGITAHVFKPVCNLFSWYICIYVANDSYLVLDKSKTTSECSVEFLWS
jgi:response regulator RpfG family c-di-GMP phosphodiesterase